MTTYTLRKALFSALVSMESRPHSMSDLVAGPHTPFSQTQLSASLLTQAPATLHWNLNLLHAFASAVAACPAVHFIFPVKAISSKKAFLFPPPKL